MPGQAYAAPEVPGSFQGQPSHFTQPMPSMMQGMPGGTVQDFQRDQPSLAVPRLRSQQDRAPGQGQQQSMQPPPAPRQQVQQHPYHQAQHWASAHVPQGVHGEWMSMEAMPPMEEQGACPAEFIGDRQDMLMVGGRHNPGACPAEFIGDRQDMLMVGGQMRQMRSTWRQPPRVQAQEHEEWTGHKQDFVEGGQELRSGRIPTPARAQSLQRQTAVKEISVQTNRQSIDGHAAEAARAATQGSARREAPAREERAAGSTGSNSNRGTRFRDLVYPAMARHVDSGPSQHVDRPRDSRQLLVQALTSAVGTETSALDEAWDIGVPGGEQRLEEAVAAQLKKICEKSLRACVLKTLRRQPILAEAAGSVAAAQEVEALELRKEQLEAEVKASEERLQRIGDLDAEVQNSFRQNRAPRECLQALVQQLSDEAAADTSMDYAAAGIEEGHDQCLQRLGLVDLWLYRTVTELEEAKADLKEREQVMATRAFAHFPEQAVSAQMALSRLP